MSTLVKMPYCWKSCVTAHMLVVEMILCVLFAGKNYDFNQTRAIKTWHDDYQSGYFSCFNWLLSFVIVSFFKH